MYLPQGPKNTALIVIDADDRVAGLIKMNAELGADAPTRTRNQHAALVVHESLA
jgi:hypothetical protein